MTSLALKRRRPRERALKPVLPNAGIEAAYQQRIDAMIAEMAASVQHWVLAAYKRNPPAAIELAPGAIAAADMGMAMDDTATERLQREIKLLADRWINQIDGTAPKLAAWFAQAANQRSAHALQRILREGGLAIDFQMTPAMLDIIDATIAQNVALIRSIPREYFLEVEGMVMRSVQQGRDLAPLAKALRERYGVTKRRAALIARDQNNKATAAMTRVRSLEAGLKEAVWVHSHAGKTPRPSHVKAGRERTRYDIETGWYDPDEKKWIQPGELINCRCVGRPIVKGFE